MLRSIFGLAFALWAGTCCASETLNFAAPGPWVHAAILPRARAAGDQSAPVSVVLSDIQVKFEDGADDLYVEKAVRLQTAAGLPAGGVALTWRPDVETLTIHRLHIIRGDQVIDVLAKGQTFTVLRRETNLERAALDGVLTATLQPEGLQVGDIVDLAYTTRRQDPVLRGHYELIAGVLPGPATDRFRMRETWPAGAPVRWRATVGIDAPVIRRAAGRVELVVDEAHALRPDPPRGAPPRFAYMSVVETSDFHNWGEISSLMAPLYQKAATLPADSPLNAEVARIRSASADPKVQAAAALHLVQDRIRYLFLGMNQGGYVPADADATWSRRFGDCKGKTALLLALLQGLGIEAEPALVSTGAGDGMDERLPSLEMFDHVLVRARIAGKTYWLDGTRIGDRGLDDLQVPNFHWALPVQASGAALERLVVPPLDKPAVEAEMTVDATGGLDALALVHMKVVYRGDAAIALRLGLANVSESEAERKFKETQERENSRFEIKHVAFAYDPSVGEERIDVDGVSGMDWSADLDSGQRDYSTEGGVLGGRPDFAREPGPNQDAPYAVGYPSYGKSTEIVMLPRDGKGFSVIGDDVDTTVAGVAFKRRSRIDKGVFTMETVTRSIAPEFAAADAPAAKIALRDLSSVVVKVRAPSGYVISDREIKTLLSRKPTLASEFMDRGDARIWAGRYAEGVADLNHAVELKPGDAGFLNVRCWGRAMAGRDLDLALKDCNASLDIDPHNAGALDSRGFVYFRMRQYDKSIADLDAALKLSPRTAESLYVRGLAERGKGDRGRGDADVAAAKAISSTVAATYALYGIAP